MSSEVEDRPNFPGSRSNWTEKIEFVQPDLYDGIPVYRVMNRKGEVIDSNHDPKVGKVFYFSWRCSFKYLFKHWMPRLY